MTVLAVAAVLVILALLGLALLLLVVVLTELRSVEEHCQSERVTAEASWQIHQQATAAFAQMLNAARQSDHSNHRDLDGPL